MSLEGVDPPQGNNNIRALNRGGGFPRLQLIPPQGLGGIGPVSDPLMLFENGITMLFENGNPMEYQGGVPVNWFDLSFKSRILLTIDKTKIPGLETDYPLLVSGTFPTLATDALPSGADIRFVLPNKTVLPHQIESFSGSGLIAHTKMPFIENVADINRNQVYMYYNKPTATAPTNAADTWDADYLGVWHLNESTGGANEIKDSTSNVQHLTNSGGMTFEAASKYGVGIDFNGSTGLLTREPITVPIGNNKYTFEAWFKVGSIATEGIIGYGPYGPTSSQTNALRTQDVDRMINYWWVTEINRLTGTNILGVTHHIMVTYDGAGVAKMYLDGLQLGSDETGLTLNMVNTANSFAIARTRISPSEFFDGTIKGVRLSKTNRSSNWALLQFNNQSDAGTTGTPGFYTVGPVVNI